MGQYVHYELLPRAQEWTRARIHARLTFPSRFHA